MHHEFGRPYSFTLPTYIMSHLAKTEETAEEEEADGQASISCFPKGTQKQSGGFDPPSCMAVSHFSVSSTFYPGFQFGYKQTPSPSLPTPTRPYSVMFTCNYKSGA